ncbi:UNVERIFIED_CONTAM: Eukaryotic translation initiation factor 2-alpha kinase [Siphonaria sp. JEL0065]|nr:Eukaryotic translation initiation factor 2-alpha kinase [Siphonaria sp. JEL0065]
MKANAPPSSSATVKPPLGLSQQQQQIPTLRVHPIPTPIPGSSHKLPIDTLSFPTGDESAKRSNSATTTKQSPSSKPLSSSAGSNKSKNGSLNQPSATTPASSSNNPTTFQKDESYLSRIQNAIKGEVPGYSSLNELLQSERALLREAADTLVQNDKLDVSSTSESNIESSGSESSLSESESESFSDDSSEADSATTSSTPPPPRVKLNVKSSIKMKRRTTGGSSSDSSVVAPTSVMSLDVVKMTTVSLSPLLKRGTSLGNNDHQTHEEEEGNTHRHSHHQRYHHHQHQHYHHRHNTHGKSTALVKERKLKQGRLLLVSLLENFCMLYDQSPERNKRLFFVLCKQLSAMGIIDSEDFLDEISAVRGAYKRVFKELVMQAMQAIRDENMTRALPSTVDDQDGNDSSDIAGATALVLKRSGYSAERISHTIPHYSYSSDNVYGPSASHTPLDSQETSVHDLSEILDLQSSRYLEDFEELRPLGKGGFGQVWCVKNKLDGMEYAVKRVKLKAKESGGVAKILREVKVQARLSHQNVVRYFSCWLEHAAPASKVVTTGDDDVADTRESTTEDYTEDPDMSDGVGRDDGDYQSSVENYPSSHDSSIEHKWRTTITITEVETEKDVASISKRQFQSAVGGSGGDDLKVNLFRESDNEDDQSGTDDDEEKEEEEFEWDEDIDIDIEYKTHGPLEVVGPYVNRLSKSLASTIETASLHTAGSGNSYGSPTIPLTLLSASDKKGGDFASRLRREANLKSTNRKCSPVKKRRLPRELTLFIQMELCGNTLQQYLNYRNKAIYNSSFEAISEYDLIRAINPSFCISVLRDICKGLLYIHSQGCIHRDIAPKNIFWVPKPFTGSNSSINSIPPSINRASSVTQSLASSFKSAESRDSFLEDLTAPFKNGGCWKIGDFGLVTLSDVIDETADTQSHVSRTSTSTTPSNIDGVSGQATSRTTGVGTVTYASPEQLTPSDSIAYTSKSDMFSVGIVLFELLHPLGTGMERAQTLTNLRMGVLPDDFVKRWPKEVRKLEVRFHALVFKLLFVWFLLQATLILSLMNKNPEFRPCARETLDVLLLSVDKPVGVGLETESIPPSSLPSTCTTATTEDSKSADNGETAPLTPQSRSRRPSKHRTPAFVENIANTIKMWIHHHPHKELGSRELMEELSDPAKALKLVVDAHKLAEKAEQEAREAKSEVERLRARIVDLELKLENKAPHLPPWQTNL